MKSDKIWELVSRFHNKAKYTIEEWCEHSGEYGDVYHIFVHHPKHHFKWGVYSGFKDDKVVGHCIGLFDEIVENIKDKTAKRYFLREARKLEMHDGLLLQDFLKPGGIKVDWNKVDKYEEENS